MKDITGQIRYQIVGHYPNSPFTVGEIITVEDWMLQKEHYYSSTGNALFHINELELSTSIFRKMYWWEHRELEELPEYVQYNGMAVYQCRWDLSGNDDERFICWDANNDDRPLNMYDAVLPSNKTDYDIYKQYDANRKKGNELECSMSIRDYFTHVKESR